MALVFLGDALVAVGYYIVFLALRANRWAASIIEVQPGQSVISTGPYSIVRHPMYSGGVLMILATPLALGSLWAFVCAVLLCGIIAARLLDEERFLLRNLPGYEEGPPKGPTPSNSTRLVTLVCRSLADENTQTSGDAPPSTETALTLRVSCCACVLQSSSA